jgi:AcrR family transcriptional regulator
VGEALVDAGARLIAAHEPLSTRRLAAAVGVSTSAVYTHFGSMDELRRAIRKVGFERLAEHLTSYQRTDDPVADLAKQGWSYCRNGLENPHMYRVMFMEAPLDEADAEVGMYTYQMLVEEVQRCIDAGRFDPGDAFQMGHPFWSGAHGAVALHLAGLIDVNDVLRIVSITARALFLANGDEPDETDASMGRAADWIAARSVAAPA